MRSPTGPATPRTGQTAIRSRHTGRAMPLIRYGSRGLPLIYVPSSGGDHREFERYGLPDDLAPWMRSGQAQVFSIDGCGPSTLFNAELDAPERITAYARFERYARDELIPAVLSASRSATLGVIGASYGAFVAANLLFKSYDRVTIACGLGGVYQMWHQLAGYHDQLVYAHTPLEYLPRLEDTEALAGIREGGGIVLFGAEDDPWLETTHQLAAILRTKELPHEVEIWSSPADHHERWWKQQVQRFMSRHFGEATADG